MKGGPATDALLAATEEAARRDRMGMVSGRAPANVELIKALLAPRGSPSEEGMRAARDAEARARRALLGPSSQD